MDIIDSKKIAEFISSYVNYLSVNQIEELIERPPKEINYTYALPVFQLAKQERKSPHLIAKNLSEKMDIPSYLDEIEPQGPYINFRVKPFFILRNIFKFKDKYGRMREELEETIEKDDKADSDKKEKSRVVIEYPSPNTNKPLHLGHVRNMLIGSSTSNLLEYKGHKVFQVNLNNDRGIHICKSMLAYKKLGNNKKPNKKSDHFVGDFYVKYNQLEEKNENIIDEAQDLLKKWEEKDPRTRALWKKMNKWAVNGFEETYNKFDISFDKEKK
jgi:arginyl-tRNA synthetase